LVQQVGHDCPRPNVGLDYLGISTSVAACTEKS
jgi:hypothetical protein